ncbi:hypothetical protein QQ045_005058 [Rhodiola kirilowii]
MGKTRKLTMATILDLPNDMLLLILARLNHEDRLTVSLVSKSFRSLTNGFVHKLTFHLLPFNSAFQKILARFWNVSIISIHSTFITCALMAISNSRLYIKRLEIYGKLSYPNRSERNRLSGRLGMVKALRLEWFSNDSDWQAVEFIHLFSSLKMLYFIRPKTKPLEIEAVERFITMLGVGRLKTPKLIM